MTDSFKNNNLSTLNIFVESCYELNLSFGNDLTEKLIIEAHTGKSSRLVPLKPSKLNP